MTVILNGDTVSEIEPDDDAHSPFAQRGAFRNGVLARLIRLVVTQLNYVVVWIVDIQRNPVPMGAPTFSWPGLDLNAHRFKFGLELIHVCGLDYHAIVVLVHGVNDQDQESVRAWTERESLPFPVLVDTDRSIAIAYGMSKAGDERYLANPAEGRRPAVIIDEGGLILKLLPDLATVEGQVDALASLV